MQSINSGIAASVARKVVQKALQSFVSGNAHRPNNSAVRKHGIVGLMQAILPRQQDKGSAYKSQDWLVMPCLV